MITDSTLFNTIIATLPSFEQVEDFDRESIFTELLDFSKTQSTQEDIFKMYFEYNKYKKILHFLRVGDIILAEYNLKYIADKKIEYSNSRSAICMESLYSPVVAYYYYKKKDYENADNNLKTAYAKFDFLYQQGYKNVVFNFVEQKINEFRIFIHTGEIDKALWIIETLVTNIISQDGFYHFDCNFRAVCLSEAELVSYLNYLFDICSAYLLINKHTLRKNEEVAISFIDQMLRVLAVPVKDEVNTQLLMTFKGLEMIYRQADMDFFTMIVNLPAELLNKNTCNSFAYIFYKTIVERLYNSDSQLYEEAILFFKSSKKSKVYSLFIQRLLQDEKLREVPVTANSL